MSRITPPKAELIRFESHDVIATSDLNDLNLYVSGLGDQEHGNGMVTFRGTTYRSTDPNVSDALINDLKGAYDNSSRVQEVLINMGGGLLGADLRHLARSIPTSTFSNAFSEDAKEGVGNIAGIFLVPDGCYSFGGIDMSGKVIQFKGSGQ